MSKARQNSKRSIYECNNKNDNEMSFQEFESEPAFYKNIVRPMLHAGHEGELIGWLKSMGILQSNRKCNKIVNGVPCDGGMIWTHSRVVDSFQWKCAVCLKKDRIRENSVFDKLKCRFKDGIRIFNGWSKGIDVETLVKILCVKKQSVVQVYNVANEIAEKYIRSNLSQWKIGGPGTIILVDTYPEGLKKLWNPQKKFTSHNMNAILCLAEIKEIPTKFWIQYLDNYNIHNLDNIQSVNVAALQIIQEIVVPGSILVANRNTQICSYDTLQSLKHLYPTIVTVEDIKRHGQMNELFNNLETIWKPCLEICKEAHYGPNSQIQSFIVNELWQRHFKSDAFEMLINQMFCSS